MPLLLQPQAEPLPGYRLIEPLGKGGFGEVWKCEAPGGLFKAVKLVRNKPDALDGERADAQLELQALEYVRSVRHPFLLSMDRIEIVDGVLVVVMELADESLHDQLRHYQSVGQAGVPRAGLLSRLWEAAEVLDVMNLRHRLLHLDVKPHNLLLLGGHVKVADFGLVSRLPRSLADGPTCRPGVVSPVYASPEAFRGEPSPSSDQYSLAVSYHELLTGELPFRAANVRQMALQHAHAEPDLSRLSDADRAVVARALFKDPARRFMSCTQFVAALLETEAAAAGPPAAHAAGSPSLKDTRSNAAVDAVTPGGDRATTAPTTVLASVQFEECTARGDTTEVWTARTAEGRQCFVKFFHGLAEIDADARRDGLHLLRSVRHPGLLPYGLVRDDGNRLIVVTPRQGPTLRERWTACRAEGRRGLPRPELMAALKNVARTVDALNRRNGAPHLALNPDAVQLAGGSALTADFGLAAWFWLPSGQPLAEINPRYAAPELGANALSNFCDSYSLAVLFQEMLTGVHPLGGGRPSARAYSQPDLSPLDAADRAVVARALDRTAGRRFPSCLDLVAALERGGSSPPAGRTASVAEVNPAAAQILAEVTADAAGGWLMRKHGLYRYLLQPGERLRHDCVARASAESAPGLLADFCRRWQAEPAGQRDGALVYRAGRADEQAARSTDKSAGWEIAFRFHSHADSPLADVRVEARPAGCGPARARQMLDGTGPALLDALRAALQAHPDRRRQDRVPFDQPVEVQLLGDDGAPVGVVHAQARDLSRTGMGLLLPSSPPGRRVIVFLSPGGDVAPTPVPARLVRVRPRDEGCEAGLLFLGEDG